MHRVEAINLAYLIGERIRTKALQSALVKAVDVAHSEGLQLSINEGGMITHLELPHHLIRSMHSTGSLLVAVQAHLIELDVSLKDQYGVIIEE